MPNVFKYTTGSAPSNTLKKNFFYFGNNTADYGTTFYTGITPPSGGFTIYLNGYPNGICRIGAVGSGPEGPTNPTYFLYGSVAICHMYNRSLTLSEVTQNYNAQKARFGL